MHRSLNLLMAIAVVMLGAVLSLASGRAVANDTGGRALVLGGGGPVGVGWETGLVAGLADKGVDLSRADYIIGTSAGSVVGANLALGRKPSDMYQRELHPQRPAAQSSAAAPPDIAPLVAHMRELASENKPAQEVRAEMGAWALSAKPMMPEAQWEGYFKRLFPEPWASGAFHCVTVDTSDGSYKVWSKDSDVPLALAVASSCAVPGIFAPIAINGQRYMDGGMRSATNADLAKGYSEVVVVSVTARPRTTEFGKRLGAVLDNEVKALKEGGAHVDLIVPDAASLAAFGPNLMDPSHQIEAAKAGMAQGQAEAVTLQQSWNR